MNIEKLLVQIILRTSAGGMKSDLEEKFGAYELFLTYPYIGGGEMSYNCVIRIDPKLKEITIDHDLYHSDQEYYDLDIPEDHDYDPETHDLNKEWIEDIVANLYGDYVDDPKQWGIAIKV